ncbi:replication protein-like protein A 70 kDa DNA-binding subunit [Lophium mytilinum]|uniref:Replication protein A subunit n=1 Tax=Lophium mytilinum TaxID=390894 RepID=A0A6A6QT22_9PEZI|nr:replication protein-like protein A 70 kDa DNA-binding subunit [Lophium mytilinum]
MAEAAISQGSLRAIFERGIEAAPSPVMQCVQIKPMDSKTGGEAQRYRVVLSDIQNFIQTMLAAPLAPLVTEGTLKKGSIVRLKQFQPQAVKGRQILILVDVEVLEEYGELEKLGMPVQLETTEPVDQKPQPAAISGNNFYGNQGNGNTKPQGRSLPSHPQPNSEHASLYPIEALSPYAHKWTIKARCTQKGEMKTWQNKNGMGKLFSVNLLDESSEIRGTAFKEIADDLYDVFQVGTVYYISNCKVVFAKKQFSNLPNDYELHFERDSTVEKTEDQEGAPKVRYNFTKIGSLDAVEKDSTIDTVGVLKNVGDVEEIIGKNSNKPFSKRELTLADDTLTSVRLTIWGNSAMTFDAPLESVIAFKGVKVSDFGGRSLSLLSSGSMDVDPDIDEAHKLKGWYDAEGRQGNYTSHAGLAGNTGGRKQEYKTVQQVKDEEAGLGEETVYFNLKASIVYVKQDTFAYPACSNDVDGRTCNRKVVEDNPGEWRCERCSIAHPRPVYRYIMSANVSDYTGQLWLSLFDKEGTVVMNMTADQLTEMKASDEDQGTTVSHDAFLEATCKTYDFRVRAKMETFQDTPRVRYQVQFINQLDFKRECARLIETLKKYDIKSEDSLFVH